MRPTAVSNNLEERFSFFIFFHFLLDFLPSGIFKPICADPNSDPICHCRRLNSHFSIVNSDFQTANGVYFGIMGEGIQ
ncbi:hypothetical protein SDJN03_14410, partial [Cucurbita argyrosperma subsp. sororia]